MKRKVLSYMAAAALTVGMAWPVPEAQARPLVLAIGGEPDDGFDPLRGWGDYGHPLFQSTLLRLDADLALTGDLATEWSLSDDALVWTVRLRDDARFSNGTPLTAADVAFTFERARQTGGRADLSVVRAVTAPDATTVEIHLSEPRITFARQLVTLGIVPAASYGENYGRAPVGSGPFRLLEWREGAQLIVAPNPHWHGGAIPFERVTFVFTGVDAAFAMAHGGGIDLLAVPPALASGSIAGMRMVAVPSVDNRGIMFPMRPAEGQWTDAGLPIGNGVTADLAIRRAVNQALDRDALVALALDGRGRAAAGPADGLPWDNPEAALPGADPDAARATLDAAGWAEGPDGVRMRDGVRAQFTLIYPAADSTRQALALGAAAQLRAIGLDVQPSGQGWPEIGRNMHANPVVFGWGAHDPLEIWNLHHGSQGGVAYFNPGFYANPAVDAHLDAAQRASSFDASLTHWKAAQWDGETGFGARADAAWAWLVNLEHTYFVSDCLDLGQVQIQPHGHGFPITAGIAQWQWTCGD